MESNENRPDFPGALAILFEKLTKYDRAIFDLENEIASMLVFIDEVSDTEIDRIGLSSSMGLENYKRRLLEHENERNAIVRSIEAIEEAAFGGEIPRTETGAYEIPWGELFLKANVKARINSLFAQEQDSK